MDTHMIMAEMYAGLLSGEQTDDSNAEDRSLSAKGKWMGVNWSMLTECYPCDEGLTNIMLYDFWHNQVVLYNRSPPSSQGGTRLRSKGIGLGLGLETWGWREKKKKFVCTRVLWLSFPTTCTLLIICCYSLIIISYVVFSDLNGSGSCSTCAFLTFHFLTFLSFP